VNLRMFRRMPTRKRWLIAVLVAAVAASTSLAIAVGAGTAASAAPAAPARAEQVLSIELHAEERGALPAPLPGQYLTLQVVGASDPAPVRSYSICAVTDSGGYRIAVKREQGDS